MLAPRFNFTPKNQNSGPVEGFDYGKEGYDPNKCNVGFNEATGQFQIEIKGLAEPKSKEAARICHEDLNEVIFSATTVMPIAMLMLVISGASSAA